VVDLYEIEDIPKFLSEAYKLGDDEDNKSDEKADDLLNDGIVNPGKHFFLEWLVDDDDDEDFEDVDDDSHKSIWF